MAQRQRISQGSGAGLTFESQPNLVIAREHICSQRPGPLVDESDCGLGILDHQNRQNRPENLLLHYWRIWRRTVQHGRRDIPGGTIDLAAANDSTGQVEHAGHLVISLGSTAAEAVAPSSAAAIFEPAVGFAALFALPAISPAPPRPVVTALKRRPTISMAAPTADATCTSGELGSSGGTVRPAIACTVVQNDDR